ncbi:hypothetical protein BW425_15035 [Bacillus pseudomycoides]|uniref:Uncharacterized protein n=1 Tax=Bacillus pseudomycoides TaxID=64104 RepID=A0A1Y3MC33_9BACI|nr:hypothetical protein BW425_15035 [Bacillus pseudomycoides]PEK72314.1 hypothetical protein CN590_03840 [Bacillus pseudomycoides]PEL24796.1 hypothetical protein CN608_17910 [Bacillus pseudomycoides]PGE86513.1 hypothetical protein COM55_08715 [Bacillus pseudomycoides]
MHRSGQILFLPHAKLKQKEKTSSGHLLFFIAADYMSENQNGFNSTSTILLMYFFISQKTYQFHFMFTSLFYNNNNIIR